MSDGKVVFLVDRSPADQPGPVASVVELAERLLGMAREGKLTTLIAIGEVDGRACWNLAAGVGSGPRGGLTPRPRDFRKFF